VPRIGVLSLQGDYACHRASLEALGVEAVRVTLPRDMEGVDAMILPGGESTTMLRLLEATGLRAPLESFARSKPVLGTCAGVILLGRCDEKLPAPTFGVLDAAIERNAYGRQIDSFSAEIDAPIFDAPYHGVFIRAPRIREVGSGVEVIARLHRAGASVEPVGIRSGRTVGLCFHPELTSDLRFHHWFLTEVAGLSLPGAAPRPVAGSIARGGRA
jgi:5'-phosphate synthase pdxT subunit